MAQNQHEGERIAKVIARAGLCSRREAEAWIAAGRVAVNGEKIASPALNVSAADKIVVDGKPLPGVERTRLFLYHKPRGLVTTTADPQGRPTIFGALPKHLPRLISIGRLDLTPKACCCSPTMAGLRARWSCRAPPGCGVIACARMARSRRSNSTRCARA